MTSDPASGSTATGSETEWTSRRGDAGARRSDLDLVGVGPGAHPLVQGVQRRHVSVVESKADDVGVGDHALTVSRLGDDHEPVLQVPADDDLGRAHPNGLGDPHDDGIRQQSAPPQR